MSASWPGSVICCTVSMTCQAPALLQDADDQGLVLLGQLGRPAGDRAVLDRGRLHPQRRARPGHAGADLRAALAAHHGRLLPVGEPADLLEDGDRAHGGVPAVEAGNDDDLAIDAGSAASTAAWISGSSSRTGTTMPGSTTESASGSTGSFSVSVMPGSTVTPLNLFQRSRKSAVSERRNPDDPAPRARVATERRCGMAELDAMSTSGRGPRRPRRRAAGRPAPGQGELGVPDAAADHHGRHRGHRRVDQHRPVLGQPDRGDPAVLHAGQATASSIGANEALRAFSRLRTSPLTSARVLASTRQAA